MPLFIRAYINITAVTLVIGKGAEYANDGYCITVVKRAPQIVDSWDLGMEVYKLPNHSPGTPTKLFSFQPCNPLSQYFFHPQNLGSDHGRQAGIQIIWEFK